VNKPNAIVLLLIAAIAAAVGVGIGFLLMKPSQAAPAQPPVAKVDERELDRLVQERVETEMAKLNAKKEKPLPEPKAAPPSATSKQSVTFFSEDMGNEGRGGCLSDQDIALLLDMRGVSGGAGLNSGCRTEDKQPIAHTDY
jgi:hypothetical protein